jgi:hypothetical protein
MPAPLSPAVGDPAAGQPPQPPHLVPAGAALAAEVALEASLDRAGIAAGPALLGVQLQG